jgi:hypothetical protein
VIDPGLLSNILMLSAAPAFFLGSLIGELNTAQRTQYTKLAVENHEHGSPTCVSES